MSDLPTVLDQLAQATSPQELREKHREVVKQIGKSRRAADRLLGPLAQTYIEAMRIWEAQKADGVSLEDRRLALQASLRAAWPKGRIEPWKYLCTRCDDCGWTFHTCTPETPCGRPFKLANSRGGDDWTGRGRCTPGHSFVLPCWCEKGQAMRQSVEGRPKPQPGDFQQAGKGRSGFTKVGSR